MSTYGYTCKIHGAKFNNCDCTLMQPNGTSNFDGFDPLSDMVELVRPNGRVEKASRFFYDAEAKGIKEEAMEAMAPGSVDEAEKRKASLRRKKTMVIALSDDDDDLFDEEPAIVVPVAPKRQRVSGGQGPKAMRWCITYNNCPDTGDALALKLQADADVKGYRFQFERGAEGTEHVQMYVELTKQVHMTYIKSLVGSGIHCEVAKGSHDQNVKYCSKADTRVGDDNWAFGTCVDNAPKKQGKRTDLDRYAELVIEEGGVTERVISEMPGHATQFAKHGRELVNIMKINAAHAEELAYWQQVVRDRDNGIMRGQASRHAVLWFGPTAVGKTTEVIVHCIRTNGAMPYSKMGNSKWWCGYEGQKVVLLDEWRKELANVEELNSLLNKGASRVETKGGTTVMSADEMHFTANRHPLDILDLKWADGRYRALARRFNEVRWWNDARELTVLKNPGIEPVDQSSEEWLQWCETNDKWCHFWRGRDRPAVAGDQVVTGEDPLYFTW